jgi:hypothetical protein
MAATNSIEIPTREFSLRKSFPAYRKRSVRIVKANRVTTTDLNWSDGTRSEYHVVDFAHGDRGEVKLMSAWNMLAPWNNSYEGSVIDLTPGRGIIRTGMFCGKQSMLTLYIHPDDSLRFGFE